jgi:hypothetical protein
VARLQKDPVDLAVDDAGGLVFVNGDLVWTVGAEAVRQQITVALRSVPGDYVLDPELGVPYFAILGGKFEINRVRELFRAALESIDAVLTINRLAVSFAAPDRRVSVDFAVATAFGPLDGEVIL